MEIPDFFLDGSEIMQRYCYSNVVTQTTQKCNEESEKNFQRWRNSHRIVVILFRSSFRLISRNNLILLLLLLVYFVDYIRSCTCPNHACYLPDDRSARITNKYVAVAYIK